MAKANISTEEAAEKLLEISSTVEQLAEKLGNLEKVIASIAGLTELNANAVIQVAETSKKFDENMTHLFQHMYKFEYRILNAISMSVKSTISEDDIAQAGTKIYTYEEPPF